MLGLGWQSGAAWGLRLVVAALSLCGMIWRAGMTFVQIVLGGISIRCVRRDTQMASHLG